MKKTATLIAAFALLTLTGAAKIWRVNNISGINTDFTDVNTAANASTVMAGDTIHVEPSPTTYSGVNLSKQLVFIGEGYLLDPANSGNSGLQAQIYNSTVNSFTFYTGANGSKFIGITTIAYSYYGNSGVNNLTFEKCAIGGIILSGNTISGLTIRKSILGNNGYPSYLNSGALSGFIMENTLVVNSVDGGALTTNNIVRNCVIDAYYNTMNLYNTYFANNLVNNNYIGLTGSIVKNNFFSNTPSLPAGAVNNTFNTALSSLIVGTGSYDAKYMLASGSAAIGAGVTLNNYTPDCGMYGGPDPYKLSGIPAIPAIYQFTVPASVPVNTPTMSVTISTRNNN